MYAFDHLHRLNLFRFMYGNRPADPEDLVKSLKVWLHRDGQTQGPYPLGEAHGWHDSGKLRDTDHLCLNGTAVWHKPGELFSGAQGEWLTRVLN